jgi:hypothetical protein
MGSCVGLTGLDSDVIDKFKAGRQWCNRVEKIKVLMDNDRLHF